MNCRRVNSTRPLTISTGRSRATKCTPRGWPTNTATTTWYDPHTDPWYRHVRVRHSSSDGLQVRLLVRHEDKVMRRSRDHYIRTSKTISDELVLQSIVVRHNILKQEQKARVISEYRNELITASPTSRS